MIIKALVTTVVFGTVIATAQCRDFSSKEAMRIISAKVPSIVNYPGLIDTANMAGVYHNQFNIHSPTDYLYLFTDGSYFHSRQNDIMPLSICETGKWKCKDNQVVLIRVKSVEATKNFDHKYLVVHHTADSTNSPYLIGMQGNTAIFSELTGGITPGTLFLALAFGKAKDLDDANSKIMRSKLLSDEADQHAQRPK